MKDYVRQITLAAPPGQTGYLDQYLVGDFLRSVERITAQERINNPLLDEVLTRCGLGFCRNSQKKTQIAREWLIECGVPEDQLDQLIVIAKLSQGST